MKKTLMSFFVAVLTCSAQQAPPANPLTTGEQTIYGFFAHNVIAGAEKMPEANYSFQPVPEVRTFGQLIGHIADANNMFCAIVAGDPPPATSVEKTKTSKADLVQAMKDAVTYCGKVYAGMTDTKGLELVKFMGRSMPKLTVLSINNAHTDEHYGNMVTYLRIKGIVPPSSEQRAPAPPPSSEPKK